MGLLVKLLGSEDIQTGFILNLESPGYNNLMSILKLKEKINEIIEALPLQADTFKTINSVLISSETTLWTPAAGKKFRFLGYKIAVTVSTGNILLKDGIGGPTIFIIPAQSVGVEFSADLGDGILSIAANNPLRAIGSSLQLLSGVIYGVEE